MYQDTENPWKKFAEEVGGKYRLSEEETSEVTGTYGKFPFILKMIIFQAAAKVNLFLTHFELYLNFELSHLTLAYLFDHRFQFLCNPPDVL